MVWGPDSVLTNLGELQAHEAHKAWKVELPSGIPLPQKCYASPLRRALCTWKITFDHEGEEQILPLEQKRVVILEVRSIT
jgi:broad specificity phosphatase PhoE